MSTHNYYIAQSKTTSPEKYEYLFNDLPDDIPTLCKIIHGIILHHNDASMYQYKIPFSRYAEMNTRYVNKMLEKIIQMNSKPLRYKRIPSERLLGICRDMAVLLCSILRHKKIPARNRVGFVNYILPDFYLDGLCVEYWNMHLKKWCYVDARTTEDQIEKLKLPIHFDLSDLPNGKFISAAEAWQLCRQNSVPSNRFGTPRFRGLWCVRNRLLQELAVLLKKEILIWDTWGMMLTNQNYFEVNNNQLEALDEICNFILKNSDDPKALTSFYNNHPTIQVPSQTMLYNPFLESTLTDINI